jgi:hypothetical protein
LAITSGPMFDTSVLAEPRKSGDCRGIDAAPWIPAASASLLGRPLLTVKAAPGKALADAHHRESGICLVAARPKQGLGRCRDVGERVTAQEQGHVVLFQTDRTEPGQGAGRSGTSWRHAAHRRSAPSLWTSSDRSANRRGNGYLTRRSRMSCPGFGMNCSK